MKNIEKTELKTTAQHRLQAEKILLEEESALSKNLEALSPEEIQRVLHELRVHQIELEMQNEELRRIQLELEAARAHYFDLYDLAPVGYCTISEHCLILQINLTTATLLGVARGALINQRISQYIYKEDQDIFYLLHKQVTKTGEPQTCELRMVRNDGTQFWTLLETAATLEEGYENRENREADDRRKNSRTVIRVVIVDISERKKAEKALLESQELFSLFLRHSPFYTYIKEVAPNESRILLASDNFQEMIGISGQDMIGKTVEELFPAEFAAKITADDWAVVASGELLNLDEDLNGRHYTTVKFPIRRGDKTLLAGYTIDITERKHAEQALRESESKYRALFDTMSEGVALNEMIFDENGEMIDYRVLEVNPAFYTTADYVGTVVGNVATKLYGMSREVINAFWRTHKSRNTVQVVEMRSPITDRHFIISTSPFLNDQFVTSFFDITERKQAEAALNAANIALATALSHEQELSRTDVLTGVSNRRHLFECAEHEVEVASRYHQPLSVIMFDLDRFKNVNDTFGHTVGDLMLQRVTQAASEELRSVDTIGRYGGEEFVILMPMTKAAQAYPLAERIRTKVEKIRLPAEMGDVTATLSIGIVEIDQALKTESADSLIRRADAALYNAKHAGRNRTVIGSR